MDKSCPGSRAIKDLAPYYIRCPHCKAEEEIWSDGFRARCKVCNAWVFREQGVTCLDWCAKAAECVGPATLKAYQQARKSSS